MIHWANETVQRTRIASRWFVLHWNISFCVCMFFFCCKRESLPHIYRNILPVSRERNGNRILLISLYHLNSVIMYLYVHVLTSHCLSGCTYLFKQQLWFSSTQRANRPHILLLRSWKACHQEATALLCLHSPLHKPPCCLVHRFSLHTQKWHSGSVGEKNHAVADCFRQSCFRVEIWWERAAVSQHSRDEEVGWLEICWKVGHICERSSMFPQESIQGIHSTSMCWKTVGEAEHFEYSKIWQCTC